MALSVYLAGKIAHGDWRFGVVDGLGEECSRLYEAEDKCAWRTLPRAIWGRFDYCGPYFINCGHDGGCYHGPRSHGAGAGENGLWCGGEGGSQRERQRAVAGACLKAARAADVVFVWLDDPSAHGTLVELGYVLGCAAGRVSDRRIVVARPPDVDVLHDWTGGHGGERTEDEMWFASALPGVEHVRAAHPVDALRAVLGAGGMAFESPAEEAFWGAWRAINGPELAMQHRVFGGAYRLDFAHLASKTAIEIDGLAYHNGQEAFRRDRSRDRRLTGAGWRVVRFTAKEVFADARRCAGEALRLCGSNSGSNSGSNGRFE